jgi:hypothetical protein
VLTLLQDPIGDRCGLLEDLESLAEGPGEAFQLKPGESPQAAVEQRIYAKQSHALMDRKADKQTRQIQR